MSENGELVLFYIKHKLSQRNYSTELLELAEDQGVAAQAQGLPLAVKETLRDFMEEFEQLDAATFTDIANQLHVTQFMAYPDFKQVMDQLFQGDVNWGRVIGLFAFGGLLCVKCLEEDMSPLVPKIVDFMTVYLDDHIQPWIQSHGGWEELAAVISQNAAAERFRDGVKKWLLRGSMILVVLGLLYSCRNIWKGRLSLRRFL